MSTVQALPCGSTVAPLGVAIQTMDPDSPGLCGPIPGFHVSDAHSKWMDIHPMQTITSTKTIEKLRIIFANHGLPQKIVTDNGPSFTSSEFRAFMSANGIVHIKSAPYHPSTNGLAERAVQTFKQAIPRISGRRKFRYFFLSTASLLML